ncbi:hypothetical protein SCUCBS95973_001285 [Sporothrix curviconia]|uniref:SGNH hydrolase-type esterase domain-containing protein n=1 Tax=Sporothrix curviconia TaxID=1260050 RepID=A0ABP0AXC9_9PEZI
MQHPLSHISTVPLPALLATSLWLLLISRARPIQAAVLPAVFARAWPSSWFGGDDTGQKTLGLTDDSNESNTGLRWTSRGFASLGDSYSAGIGTHLDGAKEESCRLGLGAYPALLHTDLGIDTSVAGVTGKKGKKGKGDKGDDDKNITAFQWLSCTGATTLDVLGSSASSTPGQIDALVTDPTLAALDFLTLSIGGNDLGFFDVINACVFRFYGYYSGTCEAALLAAEALVAEDDLDHDHPSTSPTSFSARLIVILLQLLERVRWEKRPQFRILVTGYARFFNADTDLCDSCSMSVWWHYNNATGIPSNATDTTYLTKGLRRRMNHLVAGANRKLAAVVEQVNGRFGAASSQDQGHSPRILFVDYDAAFDGHRFCEPGVAEPDYKRDATWFFLVGGTDNDNDDDKKGDALLAPTVDPGSHLVDPLRCRVPADQRGDWGERALCDLVQARAADPGLLPAVGSLQADAGTSLMGLDKDAEEVEHGNGRLVSPQNSMWYVPTYYGKTFHPRSNGHMAIRDAIYSIWEENGL